MLDDELRGGFDALDLDVREVDRLCELVLDKSDLYRLVVEDIGQCLFAPETSYSGLITF